LNDSELIRNALRDEMAPFEEPEMWPDVLRRAGVRPRSAQAKTRYHRRRLAVLVAAVSSLFTLAVSPVGNAVVRSLGDFSAWLAGEAGEPTSADEQRAFEIENERSWTRFPDGPRLRHVTTKRLGSSSFDLFGFRTGDSVCLRLTVDGFTTEGPSLGCVPLRDLQSGDTPVLPVSLDVSLGERSQAGTDGSAARASVSYGVVADHVYAVEIETTRGSSRVPVEHNAFLAVAVDPPRGLRTMGLTAISDDGRRVAVPLARAPFGTAAPENRAGAAPGPDGVERPANPGATIGWIESRELRGLSLQAVGLHERQIPLLRRGRVSFARVIRPDARSHRWVLVAVVAMPEAGSPGGRLQQEQLCVLEGGGGGCSPWSTYFDERPFSYGIGARSGGDQYAVIKGLASDDVARLELILADGERITAALNDNVHLTEVARSRFPINLVAYDADRNVIGVEPVPADPLTDTQRRRP
jgi:hypothetical protein